MKENKQRVSSGGGREGSGKKSLVIEELRVYIECGLMCRDAQIIRAPDWSK